LKILVIQTAFIGDAILATAVLESLHHWNNKASIDFMVRRGNESLFEDHPYINHLYVWYKAKNKISNLIKLAFEIRKRKYDLVINLHRFASSGFITSISGAKDKRGFDKNPLAFFYNKKVTHDLSSGLHETERNHLLIADFVGEKPSKPKLYPSSKIFESIKHLQFENYVCLAPASVWFTKQMPEVKWEQFVYLLGAPGDLNLCNAIASNVAHKNVAVLAGKLSLLQSAALMYKATMNYVNDSAPMHLCSATNAPVTVFFCSTIPQFGFGPLSDNSKIVEATIPLDCRPCGIHGFRACPQQHFKCGNNIEIQ
jgi:heptosyltransferase-2